MASTVEFLKSGWLKLNSTRSRQDAAVAAPTKHENITRKIFGEKLWYVLKRRGSNSTPQLEFDCYKDAFTFHQAKKPKATLPLSNISGVHPENDRQDCLQIACDRVVYIFECFSTEEAKEWTKVLKGCAPAPPPPPRLTPNVKKSYSVGSIPADRSNIDRFTVFFCPGSKLKFSGQCELRISKRGISIVDPQNDEVVETWPYQFIRRYSCKTSEFSFEAGRRCNTGEGFFVFTTLGSEAIQIYDNVRKCSEAIALKKTVSASYERTRSFEEPGTTKHNLGRGMASLSEAVDDGEIVELEWKKCSVSSDGKYEPLRRGQGSNDSRSSRTDSQSSSNYMPLQSKSESVYQPLRSSQSDEKAVAEEEDDNEEDYVEFC